MRKYLFAVTPFFLCVFLSLRGASVEFTDGSGSVYHQGAEAVFSYLNDHWLHVGAVLSGIFLALTIAGDLYAGAKDLLVHRRMSRRLKKWEEG